MLLMLGLFIISASGLVLYSFREVPKKLLHALIALGAGTMLSVSLIHILPESLNIHEISLYAFVGGFLMIYLLEELLTPHQHDHHNHDHTHEDPHEHMEHIIIVSWIALFMHTILDGVGISAGFAMSESLGLGILGSVAIHQIPVSLSIASLLQSSHIQKKNQYLMLILFALSAPLGFYISDFFIDTLSPVTIALATALAGGSLLYVATVELLPIIHAQSSRHMKYITILLFSVGVIGMSALAFFE